jgi:hypothetical protein
VSKGNRRAVILVVFCVAMALVVSRCDYFTRPEWTPPTPFIVEPK